jgi:hypothetical protein
VTSAASTGGRSIALESAAFVAMRQFYRDGVNRHEAHRKKSPRAAAGAVKTNSTMTPSPDGTSTTDHIATDAAIVSHHERESFSRVIEAMSHGMISTR